LSVTAQYVLYKVGFEPIVKIGDYVAVMVPQRGAQLTDKRAWVFAEVLDIEPIYPHVLNLGSVPAATATVYPMPGPRINLVSTSPRLIAGRDELLQVRIYPLDDVLLLYEQPPGIYRSARVDGPVPQSLVSAVVAGSAEVFIFEDNTLVVQPLNPRYVPLPAVRILVAAYRYMLRRIEQEPPNYTRIPAGSVSPTPPAPQVR